jgi:hypothetical protein
MIAAAAYQGITKNSYASHGFTGLLYAYAPGEPNSNTSVTCGRNPAS